MFVARKGKAAAAGQEALRGPGAKRAKEAEGQGVQEALGGRVNIGQGAPWVSQPSFWPYPGPPGNPPQLVRFRVCHSKLSKV